MQILCICHICHVSSFSIISGEALGKVSAKSVINIITKFMLC